MSVLFLNLTRGDSRMKVRFMTLPDTLSGAAWPSSSLEGTQKFSRHILFLPAYAGRLTPKNR
jgi:hypothetical protein